MDTKPRNDTAPVCPEHDWTPSPFEALTEVCAWPGCDATREASPAPRVGVDLPGERVAAVVLRAA